MKLIYILLTLCLCLGCKSKRELSHNLEYARTYQGQKDILEHETTKRDSESLNTIEIIRSKESDSDTETSVKIVEYDTSKPIDPDTGKPPVLRESESTIKAKKNKKDVMTGKQVDDNNISNQTSKSKTDKSALLDKAKGADRMKEKKSFTSFYWLVAGVLCVLGVGYCIKRKINPFDWI
nr:MAG TPA: Protein of unknown function (DUF4051) [Caudoviricetes sp.]